MGILTELFASPAGKPGLDRMLPQTARQRYAKGERWITLKGGSGEDGHGGTPVKVDGSGAIVAGPKGLAKKGVKSLSDLGKKQPKEPEPRTFDEPGEEKQPRLFDEDKPTAEPKTFDDDQEKQFQDTESRYLEGRLKSLPRYHRQIVDELWDRMLANNPDADRNEFLEMVLSENSRKTREQPKADSRKPSQKPKGEKPPRKPPKPKPKAEAAPAEEPKPAAKKPKAKPKKSSDDNLYPFASLDAQEVERPVTDWEDDEEEPVYEMTDFEDDEPKPPVAEAVEPDDRRLGLKLGDMDKLDSELENVAAQARAEKIKRGPTYKRALKAFGEMVQGWLKKPDGIEYDDTPLGRWQKWVAKSLHSKSGKDREQYSRRAFRQFLRHVQNGD